MLARYTQANISRLGEHVNTYATASQTMMEQLTQGFVAGGSDRVTAQQQALAALWGMTTRQASALSFIEIFRQLGVLCLIMLPFILILRRPQHTGGGPAHVVAE